MNVRSPRGNVLITAIFIAIFLFFLSVALVSQNRMNISLGLSVDHRLKADGAADAGLNHALHLMRTDPEWRTSLNNPGPALDSGASYEVEVRDLPQAHLFVVHATGRSGLVGSERWAVVEEIPMISSPEEGYSTSVFAKSIENQLMMIGPDFRWHTVGELPNPASSLAAAGGPLFIFGTEGTATPPPSFLDRVPLYLQGPEGLEIVPGPLTRMEVVPPGEHLLYLRMEEGKVAEWVDIPDPGPMLGSWGAGMVAPDETMANLPVIEIWKDPADDATDDDRPPWDQRQVKLTGQSRGDSGFDILAVEMDNSTWDDMTVDWGTITIPWDEITKDWDEITLDWDTITKPSIFLDWYSLDGKVLWADKTGVTCHATHYFYGHLNTEDMPPWPEYGTSAYELIVYRRPAILRYDLEKEEWTRLTDMMEMDKPDSPPRLFTSPPPNKAALAVNSDHESFTFTQEESPKLVKFKERSFEQFGTVAHSAAGVYLYKDKPQVFQTAGLLSDGNERQALRDLSGTSREPGKSLDETVPAVLAWLHTEDGGLTQQSVRPGEIREITLEPRPESLVTVGKDIYGTCTVRRSFTEPETEPLETAFQAKLETREIVTLAHYNGVDWQVWPEGVEDQLRTDKRESEMSVMSLKTAENTDVNIAPGDIAVASYPGKLKSVARYAVIASGKGAPPSGEEKANP